MFSTFPDIGRDVAQCNCQSTADLLRSAIAGTLSDEPCPQHAPDEHAAYQRDRDHADARTDADKLRDAYAEANDDALAEARSLLEHAAARHQRKAAAELRQRDPLLADINERLGAHTSNVLPLNASADAFARAMGLPASSFTDGPDAA